MKVPRLDLERRAFRRWAAFIGGLFVAQVGLWIGAVVFVAGDRSHAIVDSYDARALRWDDEREHARRSEATGWRPRLRVLPAEAGQARALELDLRDRDGRPVADADVEVVAFHHARAGDRRHVVLRADAAGTYRGRAALDRAGKWTFRIEGHRGDAVVSARATLILSEAEARWSP